MKDAIVGVITGLTWPEIRTYAVTLSRCGFEGDKVMFVHNVSPEVIQKLMSLDFKLVLFDMPQEMEGLSCKATEDVAAWSTFIRYRYQVVLPWMRRFVADYRYLLCADVRDVMFQTNPVEWLEKYVQGKYSLVVGREGWRIGDQYHNNEWMKHAAESQAEYQRMREEEVLCAGCVAGTAPAMLRLYEEMWELCLRIDPLANEQAIFNCLMRKPPYDEITLCPTMAAGFVATGWRTKIFLPYAYSTDGSPYYNTDDHVVYTPNRQEVFCIIHQYDRDPEWSRAIEAAIETASK